MQKKYWIVPGVIATALVVSLLALSNPNTSAPGNKTTCCRKEVKKCNTKPETVNPGQSSLDNLSNQFISFPVYR